MASDIYSDLLLRAVFLAALAALVASALLILSMALLRVLLVARTRRVQRMQARWRPILTAAAAGESLADLPPTDDPERKLILPLWNRLRESVKGDAGLQLDSMAIAVGLDATALAQLTAGTVPERLFAINTLGHLRTAEAWDPLIRLTLGEATTMSLAAVRALLRMDTNRALPALLPQLLRRDDWSITRLLPLLKAADPRVLQQTLLAAIPNAYGVSARRLLIFAEALPTDFAAPLAHWALAAPDEDDELVATALRLLGDPRDVVLARRFLGHANWRIRVRAISALEKVGNADDVPHLVAALSDLEWWVRLRAARTLIRLPFLNDGQTRRIQNSLEDRFARDALTQVLLEEHPR